MPCIRATGLLYTKVEKDKAEIIACNILCVYVCIPSLDDFSSTGGIGGGCIVSLARPSRGESLASETKLAV